MARALAAEPPIPGVVASRVTPRFVETRSAANSSAAMTPTAAKFDGMSFAPPLPLRAVRPSENNAVAARSSSTLVRSAAHVSKPDRSRPSLPLAAKTPTAATPSATSTRSAVKFDGTKSAQTAPNNCAPRCTRSAGKSSPAAATSPARTPTATTSLAARASASSSLFAATMLGTRTVSHSLRKSARNVATCTRVHAFPPIPDRRAPTRTAAKRSARLIRSAVSRGGTVPVPSPHPSIPTSAGGIRVAATPKQETASSRASPRAAATPLAARVCAKTTTRGAARSAGTRSAPPKHSRCATSRSTPAVATPATRSTAHRGATMRIAPPRCAPFPALNSVASSGGTPIASTLPQSSASVFTNVRALATARNPSRRRCATMPPVATPSARSTHCAAV